MILGLLILAQKAQPFPLTVESIMRGYALVGHAPSHLRWAEDGSQVAFDWAKADGTQSPPTKSYLVDANGKNLKQGELPRAKREAWEDGSRVGSKTAYESNGDILLYDSSSKQSENLTNSREFESNPVLSHDGASVVYFRRGNLFRLSLADHQENQITEKIEEGKSPSPNKIVMTPPSGFTAGRVSISPSGHHAAASYFQGAKGVKSAQVARFITDSSYVELTPTYPRVGSPQSHSQVIVYNLDNGHTTDIKPPRPGQVGSMQWAPDGSYGVVWAFSEDHKDAWLFGYDPSKESASILYDEHDDAWVGGAWSPLLGWLPDSSKFYFLSENSGFSNLMTMSPKDGKAADITEGKFEVSDVRPEPERHRFVFVSTEGSPYDRHIDAVSFDGGPRKKLADYSAGDDSEFAISPDGTKVAVIKSTTNRPPELFLNNVQVTETPTKEWLSGPWIDAPIIEFTARDGTKVPAKLFKPKDWKKGGPAVVFVHGAGYLQNVFHGWSYYFREYMFHHLLMAKGYTVLDVDYRASSGYGKSWRTAIYRHMGGKDLDDVVDGANYLVRTLGASKDRLGVYGGSYGGFITYMAMFTSPDTFLAGAALRPVGDWSNYHHGYTSPILNTPSEDPEAYKISSPINFVDGLRGHLLICHGMVDTNVQFQDTVRVVEKLIELGKKNWSVAPYPVEDHGFVRPESWTDEYNRILDLFESTIGSKRRK